MNEVIFFLQLGLLLACLAVALRMGKSAMVAFVALSGILANLFVVKQIDLFFLHVTCSDAFAVGGILALNLIQELYDKEEAKKAVKAAAFSMVCFALLAQIHLLYQPNPFDQSQGAFSSILSSSPRIIAASLFVYYLVQRLDIAWFGILKKFPIPLNLRLFCSLLLSQALDTVLFSFLGLYGLVASLFDLILMSFAIKCVAIFSASFVGSFLKGKVHVSL